MTGLLHALYFNNGRISALRHSLILRDKVALATLLMLTVSLTITQAHLEKHPVDVMRKTTETALN